jgi:WD40 repeat protein
MTVDSDGNVYVTGTFYIPGISTAYSALVTLKYDANGFLRFAQADTLYYGYTRDIAVDSSGNVYVLAGDGYAYLHVIKYDANGGRRWVRIITSPQSIPAALEVDSAGNVYVLATASNDFLIRKYDTNGVPIWSRQYDGGGTETAVDLALDSAGNVIVTGTSNNDYLTVKFNGVDVDLIWARRYNGGTNETVADLTVDSQNNIIVTGTCDNDYQTIKYDASGNVVWVRRLFNAVPDRATAVTVDSAGNVYVTGESNGSFATVSYQPNGTQRWVRTSNGGLSQCRPVAVAVDNAGNVYVAGTGTVSGSDTSYLTVKYDASGNEAVQLYDSTLGTERLTAAVLDRAMNLIVTGFSVEPYGYGYDAEIVTIKYATGAPTRIEGDVNGDGCVDDADLLTVLFNFGRGCN